MAFSLAERLAGVPTNALCAARNLVYRASEHSLDEHLDAERESFLEVSDNAGFRSAIAKFAGNGNR